MASSLDLDIEIAKAKLRLKQKGQEQTTKERVLDPFRGLNKGIALGFGFPVDAMNAATSFLAGYSQEEPVLGSKWLMRQMNRLGNVTDVQNPNFATRVAESTGAALAPVGVVGGIARSARSVREASGPIAAAGREIVEGFRQAPRATTALELGTATTGGIGAATAQTIAPDSPGAELFGEVVGGLSPTMLASAPSLMIAKKMRDNVKPLFSERGQIRMAGNAIKNVVEDRDAVERIMSARSRFPEDVRLTPAQETQDRGLMTLERAAISASAENERAYADIADATREAMRREMEFISSQGQPQDARNILDAQVNRMEELLDARIGYAQQSAKNAIDDVGGLDAVTRERANTILRGKLEEALAEARIQEEELWGAVPGNINISTSNSRAGYKRLVEGRAETADPADIPDFVHEWLRPKNGKTRISEQNTVHNLRTLRSRILGEIRAERAKKGAANRTKIGFLQQLQGDILDDLGSIPDDSLQLAREFSEQLNARFFNKPMGRILGHERAGGVEVAPELTLERTIGQRGPDAGVNADALIAAAGDTPEVRQQIGSHIQQRFLQETTEGGAVVPRRAEAFLNNNQQLLARFPEVRQQLERALLTQGAVSEVTSGAKIARAIMHDKNRDVSSIYLNAKPSREINAVLEASPDRTQSLKDLWTRMQGDPAGEAGLKSAFVREMFGRAEIAKLNADGIPGIDAKKLRRDFNRDVIAAQEAGWFSADEVKRLDQIVDVLQRLDSNFAKGRRLEEIVELPFGSGMVDLAVRLLAAPLGSRSPLSTMGSSIVTANAAVRAARRITAQMPTERVRQMVGEAMFDRDLFETLMNQADSPEKAAKISRRLNAWLINLGVEREEE